MTQEFKDQKLHFIKQRNIAFKQSIKEELQQEDYQPTAVGEKIETIRLKIS